MKTYSTSSEKIGILLTFPVMEWNGSFEFRLEYDSAVLQYFSSGCNRSALLVEESEGVVTVKSNSDHTDGNWGDRAVEVSVLFRVLDYGEGTTNIKCIPTDIYDESGILKVQGASIVTVTLNEQTSATDTSSETSVTDSVSTDSNFGSSTDAGTDSSVSTDSDSHEGTTDAGSSVTATDSHVASDSQVSDTDTESTDTSSFTVTDEASDMNTDFQETDRVRLPTTERNAVLLLCGAAAAFVLLVIVGLVTRRR